VKRFSRTETRAETRFIWVMTIIIVVIMGAVAVSLDKLESVLYKNAMAGNSSDAWNILKYRRRDVYNIHPDDEKPAQQQTNYFLNLTLEEKFKRLDRLGIPRPVIESDFEVINAPDDNETNRS
jgi:hypothetical protein